MNIGKEEPAIVVEPIEEPVVQPVEAPAPDKVGEPAPTPR